MKSRGTYEKEKWSHIFVQKDSLWTNTINGIGKRIFFPLEIDPNRRIVNFQLHSQKLLKLKNWDKVEPFAAD